jgi:hypothetical protein
MQLACLLPSRDTVAGLRSSYLAGDDSPLASPAWPAKILPRPLNCILSSWRGGLLPLWKSIQSRKHSRGRNSGPSHYLSQRTKSEGVWTKAETALPGSKEDPGENDAFARLTLSFLKMIHFMAFYQCSRLY